jgi:cytochrome c-type biogenesis protein CcmE
MIHVPKVSGAKARIKNILGLMCLMLIIAANTSAQKTVTGSVNDDFEPVIGASVVEVGTLNGTITDLDGKFTLNNVTNSGSIQVSYMGYLPQTFSVANQTTFNMKLIEDPQNLEEVGVGVSSISKCESKIGGVNF